LGHSEHCHAFVVRFPKSIWEGVSALAKDEQISVNHFITLALAERLTKFELRREASARAQGAAELKPVLPPASRSEEVKKSGGPFGFQP
jgi:hypothetical protein